MGSLLFKNSNQAITTIDDLFSQPAQLLPDSVALSEEHQLSSFAVADSVELSLLVYLAHRIRLSHNFDKLSSLSNSRTRLLPHQIEATHRVCSALRPRFLLADEVGLGKTIEAGLVMKELMLRKGYKKILVVTPATLTMQWQSEMQNRFNEEFAVMNRSNFEQIMARSVRAHSTRIITSIDFIKNEKYNEKLLKQQWDMAVFDEAHRLRRDDNKITQAYHLAEQLSSRVDALLLLSATPFRGKLEELFYLIHLLDPHLLGPKHSFYNEFIIPSRNGNSIDHLKPKLEKILIRRRKVEVGGFTRRIARTVRLELTSHERALYDATTEYVKHEYNIAMAETNRAVGFVMIVFQKLLDSSTRALLRALEKRRAMLEMRMHRTTSFANRLRQEEDDFIDSLDSIDDENDLIELASSFADDPSSIDQNLADLRKEILTLSHLIQLGRKIKIDNKVMKLQDAIAKLQKKGHKKFIIFTQFRTTQEYLAEILSGYDASNRRNGLKVIQFHGSLNVRQKEEAIDAFKADGQVLICTEAGGEGRNLQFADVLINYDLPWSPLKIEQRIGRIHRFGQKNDCLILNFSTRDTVAERVIEVLEQKIRLFEESIGPSDMLLGTVEDDLKFSRSLMNFITGRLTKKEFDQGLEDRVSRARSSYDLLNQLVAPKFVDFNLNDYYRHTRRERRIDNGRIEELVLRYLSIVEQSNYQLSKFETVIVEHDKDDLAASKMQPADDTKTIATVYRLTNVLQKTEDFATFDSDYALQNEKMVFLAAGHPLVEEAISYFADHARRQSRVVVRKPNIGQTGSYFVWVIHFKSGLEFSDIAISFASDDGDVMIADRLPFTLGDAISHKKDSELNTNAAAFAFSTSTLTATIANAKEKISEHAEKLGLQARQERSKLYRSEEAKIEISFGKKIRQLEEKKDIERMRTIQNPAPERRAVLTRTENELIKVRQEMQLQLSKLRSQSKVEFDLELLQIYHVVS
mgnify:CR=1 FL=1